MLGIYRDVDIQFDPPGQAINRFSKVDGPRVEIDFSTLASGRIIAGWLLRESAAQHPGSAKRFECWVHGALTQLSFRPPSFL